MVLIVGVGIAFALAYGIVYLKVTVDPVELWAAPESRSRLEKNYFDKNFSPFYRTEQVILHAEGLEGVSIFVLTSLFLSGNVPFRNYICLPMSVNSLTTKRCQEQNTLGPFSD